MYRIIHLRGECIGCGLCSSLAPDFWRMNSEDNKVDLKNSKKEGDNFILEISEEEVGRNNSVAKSCPLNIIHIYDGNGEDITLK